jgi:putative spermidine/putrescine transport system ATP-binding protein
MKSLILSNITHKYPSTGFTIGPINLRVEKGTIHTILGPSGSGKSTILKLAAGLLTPITGKITLDETDITTTDAEKRGIAMIFQQPLLFPGMSILDNAAFGLKMHKVNRKTRKKEALLLLKQFGIEEYADAYPSELSGGQKQRAAIARSLALSPEVILMDEPFSALDAKLRMEMRALVKQLKVTEKKTVLFVTHDRDEAFSISDTISVMQNGTISQSSKPTDLYYNPIDSNTAEFIGHENIFYGSLNNSIFTFQDVQFNTTINENRNNFCLIIPPEIFSHKSETCVGNENSVLFKLRIIDVINSQGFYHIKGSLGQTTIKVLIQGNQNRRFSVDETITVGFNPADIIIPQHQND